MSHCPGYTLEEFLTDWHRCLLEDGSSSDGIKYLYTGQLLLSLEQFNKLVQFYEPIRKVIEDRLLDYTEEENGSWRDYKYFVMYDAIPDEISVLAENYLNSIMNEVKKTKGILDS